MKDLKKIKKNNENKLTNDPATAYQATKYLNAIKGFPKKHYAYFLNKIDLYDF